MTRTLESRVATRFSAGRPALAAALLALGALSAGAGCSVRVQSGARASTAANAGDGQRDRASEGTIAATPVSPRPVKDSGIEGSTTAGPVTGKPAPSGGATAEPVKPKPLTPSTILPPKPAQPAVAELEDKPERGGKQPDVIKVTDSLGQPSLFAPEYATAFWVWRGETDKLWHIRTTSKGGEHVFRGRIGVVGGKADLVVVDNKNEHKDRYLKRPQSVHFAFRTGVQHDGFDFQVVGGKCVYFRLLVDDQPATEVYLGKENKKVDFGRFRICQGAGPNAEQVSR